MVYHSSSCIQKCENPVLTYRDIPYQATLVFNAGVAKYQGKYVMMFRNDYGDYEKQKLEGTNIGLAFSDDGIHWVKDPANPVITPIVELYEELDWRDPYVF